MKGIKGFFVCEDMIHRANEKQSREEVKKAIKKLKLKHPSASLNRRDKDYIRELLESSEEGDLKSERPCGYSKTRRQ